MGGTNTLNLQSSSILLQVFDHHCRPCPQRALHIQNLSLLGSPTCGWLHQSAATRHNSSMSVLVDWPSAGPGHSPSSLSSILALAIGGQVSDIPLVIHALTAVELHSYSVVQVI